MYSVKVCVVEASTRIAVVVTLLYVGGNLSIGPWPGPVIMTTDSDSDARMNLSYRSSTSIMMPVSYSGGIGTCGVESSS
jgi:hypothetical protein